ncbi:MAG: alpha/beta fold hydrolase [Pseudomonadota bacterium]
MSRRIFFASLLASLLTYVAGCSTYPTNGGGTKLAPLVIQDQGSFAVGGTVKKAPGTFDPVAQGAYTPTPNPQGHAYVFYQVPANTHRLPLVFWHGHGQSAKTWESTPDGREGFQNIFLRERYSVYLLDQPRRGRAGKSTAPVEIPATPDEQMWFGVFRLGVWPDFFPGVSFAKDPGALEQFFRQAVPNSGPYDVEANTSAVSALFMKIGPGTLVTHSQSGTLGWRTAMKSPNVRAVVSFEPGGDFVFPEGEAPSLPFAGRAFTPPTVPLADFRQLTRIPILVYYGDNIPDQPSANPGQEQWRVFREVARRWRDTVNRHGGDVTLVELPSIGIRGNTHFPMSDTNNADVAEHMADWLHVKGLDR